MSVSELEAQAVEMLAQNEELIGGLYALYAGLFPEEQAFWSQLSEDEGEHARMVRAISGLLAQRAVEFREGRYAPDVYATFMAYVRQRQGEARAKPPTLFEALSIARDIEHTMMEKFFFEVFAGITQHGKDALNALDRWMRKHIELVEAQWLRYRPSRE